MTDLVKYRVTACRTWVTGYSAYGLKSREFYRRLRKLESKTAFEFFENFRRKVLTDRPIFDNSRIIEMPSRDIVRLADRFAAMGTESRLRIMQLLLSAHPEGMVVGDIHGALAISGSTLSHHLEKLKNEDLVTVQREGTFLRYRANAEALQELLAFLYAECCTRNRAIKARDIVQICK